MWEWKLSWRKEWFECEKLMVEDLLEILQRCKPIKAINDECVLKGRYGCQYAVKDASNKLVNRDLRNRVRPFKNCGNSRVLPLQCYAAREFFMTSCQLEKGWCFY